MSAAFLIVRIILGLGLAAHGAQKLFGWFGGHGLAGTGGFFEQLGFRPGRLFALAAGLGELVGGLLTFLGLGGALGPVIVIMVMLVAIVSVHLGKGFFSATGGPELPLLNVASALALAFAGNGAYALDRLFGINFLTGADQVWYAVAAAVIVAALNLLARRAEKPAAAEPSGGNGSGVRRGSGDPVQSGRGVGTGSGVKTARAGSVAAGGVNGVGVVTGSARAVRTSRIFTSARKCTRSPRPRSTRAIATYVASRFAGQPFVTITRTTRPSRWTTNVRPAVHIRSASEPTRLVVA